MIGLISARIVERLLKSMLVETEAEATVVRGAKPLTLCHRDLSSVRIMKRMSVIVFLISLALVSSLLAQESRTTSPSLSVTEFRPIGNLRMWTFTYRAKPIGTLYSAITGRANVNNASALKIERRLSIDYSELQQERRIEAEGRGLVSPDGFYLGESTDLTIDSVTEHMEFELDEGVLSGYFTRGGEELERDIPIGSERFGWDANFVDQLEIYLAMHELRVGAHIEDSIYIPQAMYTGVISGMVREFTHMEIYKGYFDSVYAIELVSPQHMAAFMTPGKRLVRFDFLPQRIRVYLDMDRQVRADETAPAPVLITADWFDLVSTGVLLLLIAALCLLLFGRPDFGSRSTWPLMLIGLVIGGGVAWLAHRGIHYRLFGEGSLMDGAQVALFRTVFLLAGLAVGRAVAFFRVRDVSWPGGILGAATGLMAGVLYVFYSDSGASLVSVVTAANTMLILTVGSGLLWISLRALWTGALAALGLIAWQTLGFSAIEIGQAAGVEPNLAAIGSLLVSLMVMIAVLAVGKRSV